MTKYRQTFTVETEDPQPFVKLLGPLQHLRRTHFTSSGADAAPNGTTVSWTAPEPIIEVPTGIGAVVASSSANVAWVKTFDLDGKPWKSSDGNSGYKSDAQILDLLKAGAEIKSHGVEL